MTDDARKLSLFDGLQLSGMTPGELWLSYYSVGGNASELEVEAYALGLLRPDAYQHNLIAQAINESFVVNGQDHPVSYQDQHAS
jgi:hypothetical protein